MHVAQLLKILKFSPPQKKGGEDPLFENFEILFENFNKGAYINLETKFHACRSIIEDFEIFTPPKRGGKTPLKFFFGNEISSTEFLRNFPFD